MAILNASVAAELASLSEASIAAFTAASAKPNALDMIQERVGTTGELLPFR
jgi:hypothetical protein